MLQNFWSSFTKRCPQTTSRIILLPLATLGIIGFFINTHVSFISSNFGVCYPKINVVFLKTHKCAGSSIQNILMRYGDSHELNFMLPPDGNYIGHPAPFSRTLVPPPLSFSYNILAHHTRLDYREIKAVMPSNSVYITIIRDPVQIFESSYSYYRLDRFYGSDLHKFIKRLPFLSEKFVNKRYKGKFGINQMMFDLGADPSIFNNETLVREYIDKLDSWFNLVLVADRMDESLVLLRHLLCWEVDDVVTFKTNARDDKFRSALNEREVAALRKLNSADFLLYNHFLQKFEKQIEAFGSDRMAAETAELRERTQKWYELCVKGERLFKSLPKNPKYYHNPRVMVFEPNNNVSNSTCNTTTMVELHYTDILRRRQVNRLPFSFGIALFSKKNSAAKKLELGSDKEPNVVIS